MSSDEKLINKYNIPTNENLTDYAMAPIYKDSLFIKNGVMFILGGVSSGKSTLLSKLVAVYTKAIQPIILCFYSGLTPDETTTFALSSFGIHPHFIKLSTPEAMFSFFNQFRYKRLKLAELLMFLQSVFKNNIPLILSSVQMVEELGLTGAAIVGGSNVRSIQQRLEMMLEYIQSLITKKRINTDSKKGFIYSSEYLLKTYARKHKINFNTAPTLFIVNALISFSKGFKPQSITVDILNDSSIKTTGKQQERRSIPASQILSRFTPYTFEPFIRVRNTKGKIKLELIPSISIFDDVASFPLLTAERSTQWIKDLFAETRRWQNTFIIAAQRHNLLNKTLRSLTHTFFIGFSLVDDDIPRIAKEIPSNLLSGSEFKLLYNNVIKPFTFFVYNNKLGYNVLTLK